MNLARSLGLALLFASCVAAAPQKLTRKRPNIVVILADDHAAHAIGAYGGANARTPNLDRLAREGLRFDNAFCGNSICAPSRASILTGVHSHVHGVIDNAAVFDGAQPTFAKALHDAGYRTALFGKWHLKSDPTGFDAWEVFPDQGEYYDPKLKTPEGVKTRPGYASEVVTDLALDWLGDREGDDEPFLLCLHHKAPHRSWEPGPRQLDLYRGEVLKEAATLFDDYSTRSSAAAAQEMTVARHLTDFDLKLGQPTPKSEADIALWRATYDDENAELREHPLEGDARTRWNYQRYLRDYLRCVAGVDASVGRVLDWLDAHGLAQDTLVVYLSDQGFYLGDHGWYDKRWMYEESLRLPLIARWPGVIAPGRVDRHLVQTIDVAPTLCELGGAAPLARAQGTSLTPLLAGEEPANWRDAIYYRYYEFPAPHRVEPHFGVRTRDFKLLRFPRIDAWELYDLANDPHELHNLAAQPGASPGVLQRELTQRLASLQAEFGDQP